MGRRRAFAREREEQARPRLQRAEVLDRDGADPVQREVLRLQRTGGNEAVAAVLAREAVAQDSGGAEEKSAGTFKLEGIGHVEMLSFMETAKRKEVDFVLPGGSPMLFDLQRGYELGDRFLSAEFILPHAKLGFKDVTIKWIGGNVRETDTKVALGYEAVWYRTFVK